MAARRDHTAFYDTHGCKTYSCGHRAISADMGVADPACSKIELQVVQCESIVQVCGLYENRLQIEIGRYCGLGLSC